MPVPALSRSDATAARPSSVPVPATGAHPAPAHSSGPPSAHTAGSPPRASILSMPGLAALRIPGLSSAPSLSGPPPVSGALSAPSAGPPLPLPTPMTNGTNGNSGVNGAAAAGAGAGGAPSNDDIEAVIKMAMAASPSPARAGAPLRDTRTQLFVGNLPYRVRWQDLKDLFRRAGTVLRADVALGPDNRSRGHGTVLLGSAEDAGRAVDMFNGYCWQTRVLEVRLDRMDGAGAGAEVMGVGMGMGITAMGVGTGTGTGTNGLGTPLSAGAGFALGLAASPAPASPRAAALAGAFGEDDASRPGTGHGGAGAGAMGGGGGPSRNLFVGNLPFHIQWQDLKDLFRQAGAVTRADVALGPDGRSRGFGTVAFAGEPDAERAVRMFNGYEYNGRALKVHFDKFSAPSSTAALAVAPPPPHSPAFALAHAHAQGSLAQGHASYALSQAASFAQQILQQQQHERQQQPGARGPAEPPFQHPAYDELAHAHAHAVHQQHQHQHQHQHQQSTRPSPIDTGRTSASSGAGPPGHIALPYRSPYAFEVLSAGSGPSSPYDVYEVAMGRQGAMAGILQASRELELDMMQEVLEGRGQEEAAAGSRPGTGTSARQQSAQPPLANAENSNLQSQVQAQMQAQAQSQSYSHSQSHSHSHSQSHSQSHSHSQPHSTPHPHHPGPIAIPPPPPVSAFPVSALHTLSPPYPFSPHMHPASPLHHPAMMSVGMGGVSMTPHGLPPITPSMPSFTFLPQPSPAPEQHPAPAYEGGGIAALHHHGTPGHAMPPFAPFSPGAVLSPGMSPGALWGRPGSGAANPFINPAVGAPVHAQPHPHPHPHPGSPTGFGFFGWCPSAREGAGAVEEQGYFPPVPVSMAMAQGGAAAREEQREPPGYFPLVPPGGVGPMGTGASRPSALANEIRGSDSGSNSGSNGGGGVPVVGNGQHTGGEHGRPEERRAKSTHSEATTAGTGSGTDVSPRPSSSQGTSWHTDGDEPKRANGVRVNTLAKGIEALAVEDGDAAQENGTAKPRAYSAETGAQAPGMPPVLQRADSDPVRTAAALAGRVIGLGIDMSGSDAAPSGP